MGDVTGKTINGRYRIESFLGKGGMAEVYKVWDESRSVPLAMKIMHADMAEDKIFLRRFKREAQTLQRLQHPNIVRFYGLEQADSLVFLLMEYVEGTTLRKEIFDADEPFSLERILQVMQPVTAALHYAHQSGFVHCDVKPANIMLHKNGNILVADFGIARMSENATVTLAGAGTPAYMSPEQILGDMPTPQMDVYALGVILFEMVTGGERPFTGENARITGTTAEKIRWEQRNLASPPPHQYNPSIPAALEDVVLTCLQKDPSARYGSVLDMYADLLKTNSLPAQPVIAPRSVDGDEHITELSPPPDALVGSPNRDYAARDTAQRGKKNSGRKLKTLGVVIAGIVFIAIFLTAITGGISDVLFLQPTHTAQPTPTRKIATVTPRPTQTPRPVSTKALLEAPNLALNKKTTSNSSSCASSEAPSKAVNGTWNNGLGDKWCAYRSGSLWWQVDLGGVYRINKIVVYHAGAGGERTSYNTRGFNLQVSKDGVRWNVVAAEKNNKSNITTHRILPVDARYIRLVVLEGEQNGLPTARIYEVQVFGENKESAGCVDEFDTLSDWQKLSGSWEVGGGRLCVRGDFQAYNKCSTKLNSPDYKIALYNAVLYKSNATAGNYGYGVYFRSTDFAKGINGYTFQYDPGLSGLVYRKWVLGREYEPFATLNLSSYDWFDVPRDIEISIVGNTFKTFVGGRQVLSSAEKSYPDGGVGLRTWGGNVRFCVDGFAVEPLP